MTETRRENLLRREARAASSAAAAAPAKESPSTDVEQIPIITPPPTEEAAIPSAVPQVAPQTANSASQSQAEERTPLFSQSEAGDLRSRWDSIQVRFVDEPRNAVQEADAMVASVTKRLADIFSDERQKLEREWERGTELSTEELRLALRRYRSFFTRLLSV